MTFFYVESSFLTFAFERQKKDSVQLGGKDSPSLVAPFSLFTFHNKGSIQILQSFSVWKLGYKADMFKSIFGQETSHASIQSRRLQL